MGCQGKPLVTRKGNPVPPGGDLMELRMMVTSAFGRENVGAPSGGTVRGAPRGMRQILSLLSIKPGKQPLDQLDRRLRNRYVSVLPHADRGARDPHDLGEDRLREFESMPDGHQECRFHVTLPLRATTPPSASW